MRKLTRKYNSHITKPDKFLWNSCTAHPDGSHVGKGIKSLLLKSPKQLFYECLILTVTHGFHQYWICNYRLYLQETNLYCDCSVFCKIRVFIFLSRIAVMYISPANFMKPIFVRVNKSCVILKCKNNYRTKTATCIHKIIRKNMKLFVTICKISIKCKI